MTDPAPIFADLYRRLARSRPDLARSLVVNLDCPLANREHAESVRQYAHVGHELNTVCLASEALELGPRRLRGILAHEIGHLLAGLELPEPEGENAADRAAHEQLGVAIKYGKDALQYA